MRARTARPRAIHQCTFGILHRADAKACSALEDAVAELLTIDIIAARRSPTGPQKMMSLLAALALQTATPAFENASRAEEIARLATAVGACDRVGYSPLESEATAIAESFEADLRAQGLSPQQVSGLAQDARTIEGNQLARALDFPSSLDNGETRRIAKEARAFVLDRCRQAKIRFPSAFAESPIEGQIFLGHLGLWLDYPLIEETEFYLTARGACSSFLPPFDAQVAAERLSRPFANEATPALSALREKYRTAYRDGLGMGRDFDAVQCGRLMNSADAALTQAWSIHFSGNAPFPPLP